jgi:hypothetical protein
MLLAEGCIVTFLFAWILPAVFGHGGIVTWIPGPLLSVLLLLLAGWPELQHHPQHAGCVRASQEAVSNAAL